MFIQPIVSLVNTFWLSPSPLLSPTSDKSFNINLHGLEPICCTQYVGFIFQKLSPKHVKWEIFKYSPIFSIHSLPLFLLLLCLFDPFVHIFYCNLLTRKRRVNVSETPEESFFRVECHFLVFLREMIWMTFWLEIGSFLEQLKDF